MLLGGRADLAAGASVRALCAADLACAAFKLPASTTALVDTAITSLVAQGFEADRLLLTSPDGGTVPHTVSQPAGRRMWSSGAGFNQAPPEYTSVSPDTLDLFSFSISAGLDFGVISFNVVQNE